MTRWMLHLMMSLLLAGLMMAGCGSARRGTPVQPPFDPSGQKIQQGRQVFMRYCNGCHPGGEAGLGFAINNRPLPGFLIRFQVRHGLGVMPSFSEEVISDEQLDALSAYLIKLRRHDGEVGRNE